MARKPRKKAAGTSKKKSAGGARSTRSKKAPAKNAEPAPSGTEPEPSPTKKSAARKKPPAARKPAARISKPAPPTRPAPAEKPARKPAGKPTLAAEDEVLEVLEGCYPRGVSPQTVAYFLTDAWRRNLEARAMAEQGDRFLSDLGDLIEDRTGLDVVTRSNLVDRPAWLLRVLLHPGRRLPSSHVSDDVVTSLGGEVRLLDLWVSSLGPFYYARGYRIRSQIQEELEGPPPPLDREDPVALKAMRVAARALRNRGFRRVPGTLAKRALPGLRSPASLDDDPETVFDLLFSGALAGPPPPAPEPRRPRAATPGAPPDEEGVEPESDESMDLALEMELFQRELEEELDQIRDEIERAKKPRRSR